MPSVHLLQPKPGQTLKDSYSGIAYANTKGNTECVEFLRQALSAPPTMQWKEGKKVTQGDATIAAGAPIATFVNGKYPQSGSTGMHAAIYLGQNAVGIQVLDQWRAQGQVKQRTIRWNPNSTSPSNDAKAFSVVEW
jgi:hypothetical protein